MFIAFNYTPTKNFYNTELNNYMTKGASLYSEHESNVQGCLSKFISPDGTINGSELRENWFSVENTDVFISHSHKDINKVKAFAGWLSERFGLTSFVDSCAWGYCDELLHTIDKKYCYNKKKGTYDYELRNYTTSHVHMMLSTALVETMNRSECIIFFNTPQSIVMSNELESIKKKQRTTSPWIFYELTMISRLNRIPPNRDNYFLEHSAYEVKGKPNIQYDVSAVLDRMPTIYDLDLLKWREGHSLYKHPLDELYEIKKCGLKRTSNKRE